MNGKRKKNHQHRYEYDACWPCSLFAEIVEFDPTQNGNFQQEQNEAEQCWKSPCRLDVPVQTFVRRFVHQRYAVQIANGLDVGQDAGADHEGEHVHGNQECGANGKSD